MKEYKDLEIDGYRSAIDNPLLVMQFAEILAFGNKHPELYQYYIFSEIKEAYDWANSVIDLYKGTKNNTVSIDELKHKAQEYMIKFYNEAPSAKFCAFMRHITINQVQFEYKDYPLFKELVGMYAPYMRQARIWVMDFNLYERAV